MRFRGEGALTTEEAGVDREVRVALDGHAACKSMREAAEVLYGAEREAPEWTSDSRPSKRGTRSCFINHEPCVSVVRD